MCRYGRCERGLRHHPHGRQFLVDRQGCDVGQERVRQYRQVPAVPADRERRRGHRSFHRRLRRTGLAPQGRADAVGQPYYGHARITRAGHGNAHARSAAEEALRQNETPHLQDDDEEHSWSGRLSVDRHFYAPLRW